MSRRALGAAVVAAALALTACGTRSADLFVVDRSGELPGAKLSLVIGDGGQVECDGTERPMTSKQLIEARDLTRDLEPLLKDRVKVPARQGAQLRFKVTGEHGTVEFADTSGNVHPVFARLIRFTRAIATGSCKRPR